MIAPATTLQLTVRWLQQAELRWDAAREGVGAEAQLAELCQRGELRRDGAREGVGAELKRAKLCQRGELRWDVAREGVGYEVQRADAASAVAGHAMPRRSGSIARIAAHPPSVAQPCRPATRVVERGECSRLARIGGCHEHEQGKELRVNECDHRDC